MPEALSTMPEASNAEDAAVMAALLTPGKPPAKASEAPPVAKQSPVDAEAAAPEETPPEESPAELEGDEAYLEEEDSPEAPGEIDPDEVEYEVRVDDALTKVKLKDLKANFSGQIVSEKRIQEATERRAQAEQVGQALYNTLGEQAQRLQQLDSYLAESQPQVDWNKLRLTDPQGYLIAKERQRDIEDRRRSLAGEQQRIAGEQARLTDMANEAYSQDQARKLMDKMPELSDPVKSGPALERLTKGATEHYSFTSHEIAAVLDHRALLVLNDALKYRELLARKAAKGGNGAAKVPSPTAVKTLLRPGNSTPSGSEFSARMTAAKAEKAAVEQARKTGSVDDVANMLLVRTKKA